MEVLYKVFGIMLAAITGAGIGVIMLMGYEVIKAKFRKPTGRISINKYNKDNNFCPFALDRDCPNCRCSIEYKSTDGESQGFRCGLINWN